jgi:hypothetical protein
LAGKQQEWFARQIGQTNRSRMSGEWVIFMQGDE